MASRGGFFKNVLCTLSLYLFFSSFNFVRRVISLPQLIDASIITLSANYPSKSFPTISFPDIPKVSEREKEMDKSPLSLIQTFDQEKGLSAAALPQWRPRGRIHALQTLIAKNPKPQTKRQTGISHLKTRLITSPFNTATAEGRGRGGPLECQNN